MAERIVQEESLTLVADAIRAKGGTSDALSFPTGFADAISAIQAGGGGGSSAGVSPKEVNFYDYDGTCLYAYSVAEAQALTELPPLPERDGLICQGWNWSLEDVTALTRPMNVGAMYITDDGKTRIYIRLEDGRTSPLLGCCPNGTVTVDWGDGTTPDTLTGTSTSTVKWTPTHNYATSGDYVITLTVDGKMGFYGSSTQYAYVAILRHSSSSNGRNQVYSNSVRKIEIGNGVTSIRDYAFYKLCNLTTINIPNSVTSIGKYAFNDCSNLTNINIPNNVTSIGGDAFSNCHQLINISMPNSVTSIGSSAYSSCYKITNIGIPNEVTSTGGNYDFRNCRNLINISMPNSITSIGGSAFYECYQLTNIIIPNSVTSIGSSAFYRCYGMRYYDFTTLTAVPTLSNTNAFSSIPDDCQIRVPAALYDEWIAATNWSTYASNIVAV